MAEQPFPTVVGFMTPIFSEETPHGTNHGLGADDFYRVVEGYGCGECLAIFATYLAVCPVCGTTRDVQLDVQNAPDLWVQHLQERHRPDAPATGVRTFDEFMASVGGDDAVEQIPLSKLHPRHRPKMKR